MRAMSALAGSKPAFCAGPHFSVVANVETSPGDVVEVLVNDDAAENDVFMRLADRQTRKRKDVCPSIFEGDEVQNPLRLGLQKQENNLLWSLRASKYQEGTALRTVASSSSGAFGAVSVYSKSEHREKERFLKGNFSLTVVDGRHCRSCTHKLATYGQLGTNWPSQPIWMTPI